MPVLDNARHERFAQGLAEGRSADEAYALAGFKANRGNAARLNAKDSVRKRVAELQAKGAERAAVTLERLTDMLTEDRELARSMGQSAAAVSATEKLGKLHGFFADRSENVNTNYDISDQPMSPDEWARHHTTH